MSDDLKARLLPISEELYESYPGMSAQSHEWHVKQYAKTVSSKLTTRIEALEAALNLAANRLARCAIDHDVGTRQFIEIAEWGEEARAALALSGVCPACNGSGHEGGPFAFPCARCHPEARP